MALFQLTCGTTPADSAGANHEVLEIVVGANNQRIGGSIAPGQTIECCAIARVPGNVDAQGLAVTCSGEVAKYDVAGQAPERRGRSPAVAGQRDALDGDPGVEVFMMRRTANAVFGAFTWDPYGDDAAVSGWPYREIDIEFSRWGSPAALNS